MGDYSSFTITVQTWEDDDKTQGPRAVVGIDTSQGHPMITQFYYESDRRGVDVAQPFRSIDFDQLVALMPKGAAVYEAHDAKEILSLPVPTDEDDEPPAFGPQWKLNRERSQHHAAIIAEDIGGKIKDGTYRTGTLLPSRANLIRQYPEMTAHSLKIAIRTLQAAGLLGPGNAAGIRVLDAVARPAQEAVAPPAPVPGPRVPQGRLATKGHPSPDKDELLAKLAVLGDTKSVAKHYNVPYHTAHGWLKRAERDRLAALPIVDPTES